MKTRFLGKVMCLGAFFVFAQMASAAALFTGQFDIANFTLDTMGGIGSVDTGLAPNLITLNGHDAVDEEVSTVTSYLVNVASDATFEFYWKFATDDDDASFDPFGYILNGLLVQLTDDGLSGQSGFLSLNLLAGDNFGFYTDAIDSCCGASHTQISGDQFTDVPEPSSLLLMAAGLGAIPILRRRRIM